MFSIIADEARDVSCSEQMSICIRYVKDARLYERFVKFVDVHTLDAQSLASELTMNLKSLGLNLSQCVGQCYDGASVISGRLNGVQVHVCKCKSPCLYLHCYAHHINLVIVNARNNCPCVIEALGLMEAIYCFTNASTLRHEFKFAGLSSVSLSEDSVGDAPRQKQSNPLAPPKPARPRSNQRGGSKTVSVQKSV